MEKDRVVVDSFSPSNTNGSSRSVFVSKSLQNEFELNGYVVIPGFLEEKICTDLDSLYLKYSPSIKTGFHVTNWEKNDVYRKEAHQYISDILTVKLATVLLNYKPVLGCFAAKEPNFENAMGLHQDWSVTDESNYTGISAWIPLTDVDENSGAVKVLRGSHRLFKNIRGQKIRNMLNDISQDKISRYLVNLPMKAGDMLVLHHRLVHCSGNSNKRRVAGMMALIPEEAEVKHYLAFEDYDTSNKIRVFNCPADFYVNFDIDSFPETGIELTPIQQTNFVVTDQMVIDACSK